MDTIVLLVVLRKEQKHKQMTAGNTTYILILRVQK
nr:MAG TPA: hypothetical protein [Caudoviricetes sp.]DAX17687.1 MAG TPA: hypothetical protein [Caudoviricetes sp.]